jgi:hypothetical protein
MVVRKVYEEVRRVQCRKVVKRVDAVLWRVQDVVRRPEG